MDASAYAFASLLAILCFLMFLFWMLYSIFGRILRAFARTTRRTSAAILGIPYRKR